MAICGNCKDTGRTVAEIRSCYAQAEEDAIQWEAEAFADAIASWVTSGGNQADARLYATVIASGQTWESYLAEQDAAFALVQEAAGTCEHALSAALCEGTQHYPADV